jgi:hypothetical protein
MAQGTEPTVEVEEGGVEAGGAEGEKKLTKKELRMIEAERKRQEVRGSRAAR